MTIYECKLHACIASALSSKYAAEVFYDRSPHKVICFTMYNNCETSFF